MIEMKRLKIDILGTCEMRQTKQFTSGDYRAIYSGGYNRRNKVGIILNTKWTHCDRSHITDNDRLITVKLKSIPTDIAKYNYICPQYKLTMTI